MGGIKAMATPQLTPEQVARYLPLWLNTLLGNETVTRRVLWHCQHNSVTLCGDSFRLNYSMAHDCWCSKGSGSRTRSFTLC